MQAVLRQSTASQIVWLGPFIDQTDGITVMTGLTIANTDIRLSKNGANIAAKNSGGGTHDELGHYTATLDATDTNTVGRLRVMVHMSGALPVWADFQVLEEAVFDNLYAASAVGPLAADTTGSGLTAVPWNAAWDAEVQSECADALNAYDPPTNAEMVARTIAAADYALATATTAIELDTQDIQSRLPAALVSGRMDSSVGVMANNVMTAAAAAADLTTELQSGLATAAALATVDGIVDALLVTSDKLADTLEDSGGGAYIFTTASLANAPSGGGGGGASAAEVADAVWDELVSGHAVSGSFGALVSAIKTNVDAVLDDTGTSGVIVASIANNAITAAAIADNAIDAGAIASNAITAAKIASSAITSDKIAGDAIGATQIAAAALTAAKFDADALTAAKFASDVGTEFANALLDLTAGVESGLTVRQHMRLSASALFGKASGLETTSAIYRDFNDSKARITATVDSNGNRAAIVRDAT